MRAQWKVARIKIIKFDITFSANLMTLFRKPRVLWLATILMFNYQILKDDARETQLSPSIMVNDAPESSI